jgi:hypothetical protein
MRAQPLQGRQCAERVKGAIAALVTRTMANAIRYAIGLSSPSQNDRAYAPSVCIECDDLGACEQCSTDASKRLLFLAANPALQAEAIAGQSRQSQKGRSAMPCSVSPAIATQWRSSPGWSGSDPRGFAQ